MLVNLILLMLIKKVIKYLGFQLFFFVDFYYVTFFIEILCHSLDFSNLFFNK